MQIGGGCDAELIPETEETWTVRDVPFLTAELALGGYTV